MFTWWFSLVLRILWRFSRSMDSVHRVLICWLPHSLSNGHSWQEVYFSLTMASFGKIIKICYHEFLYSSIMVYICFACVTMFSISLTRVIEADVAAAVVLISMGAMLGRTTPTQLLWMALIEIVVYASNEYVQLEILKVMNCDCYRQNSMNSMRSRDQSDKIHSILVEKYLNSKCLLKIEYVATCCVFACIWCESTTFWFIASFGVHVCLCVAVFFYIFFFMLRSMVMMNSDKWMQLKFTTGTNGGVHNQ